jgi:hypothetical protein
VHLNEGAGFGVRARPMGAYSVNNGAVRWRPAIAVNRLIAAVAAVVATYLVDRSLVKKATAKSHR